MKKRDFCRTRLRRRFYLSKTYGLIRFLCYAHGCTTVPTSTSTYTNEKFLAGLHVAFLFLSIAVAQS